MTLSCSRFRVLMALGVVFFGYMLGAEAYTVAAGRLPDTSPGRLAGAAGIGLVLALILFLLAAGLTARVAMDDAGVHLLWLHTRRSLDWRQIENVTLQRGHRVWRVRLHLADRVVTAAGLMCPIWFGVRLKEREFEEPPAFTPGSIRNPYQTLRSEWQRRRAGAPA